MSMSECLLAMQNVLIRGLLLLDADERDGFSSLRQAFEESGDSQALYLQSGYTSFETLWRHLRGCLGAYLGTLKSVSPLVSDKPATMHSAAQLRGDERDMYC
jgi:hypothetical protein